MPDLIDSENNIESSVIKLVKYIEQLDGFIYSENIGGDYNHIGATIIDATLQAGVNYDTVVAPRISEILKNYPDARTLSEFISTLENVGYSKVINWKDESFKVIKLKSTTELFKNEKIETESDLRMWLSEPTNLEKLKSIKGIKNKTADYLQILVGIKNNAIDRHILRFLHSAGISTNKYDFAHNIIHQTAERLKVDEAILDNTIWRYVRKNKKKLHECTICIY